MKHNAEKIFMEAYELHADAIFRHCYFRVSERERARELTQETFMRAWEYVAGGENVTHMKSLLYRIANNLVIDEWRKRKSFSLDAMQEEQGFDVPHDDTQALARAIDAKEVLPHLEKLEAPYRDALVMRYIDDMSPKDIAKVIGETENVVSVRIYRGLKKLKALIQPQ